jgi:hypothetical protein
MEVVSYRMLILSVLISSKTNEPGKSYGQKIVPKKFVNTPSAKTAG